MESSGSMAAPAPLAVQFSQLLQSHSAERAAETSLMSDVVTWVRLASSHGAVEDAHGGRRPLARPVFKSLTDREKELLTRLGRRRRQRRRRAKKKGQQNQQNLQLRSRSSQHSHSSHSQSSTSQHKRSRSPLSRRYSNSPYRDRQLNSHSRGRQQGNSLSYRGRQQSYRGRQRSPLSRRYSNSPYRDRQQSYRGRQQRNSRSRGRRGWEQERWDRPVQSRAPVGSALDKAQSKEQYLAWRRTVESGDL